MEYSFNSFLEQAKKTIQWIHNNVETSKGKDLEITVYPTADMLT